MRKLIFILLASLAVFTYIRALDAEDGETPQVVPVEIEH
jgi:hypothetical protein